jgi:uncharacterized protein
MTAVLRQVIRVLRSTLTAVLLLPVHLWRATAVMRQPRCRYYPSCSTYAVDALRDHGPFRGAALAAGRVLRCHPWSPGGIDHVPPSRGETGERSPSSSVPSTIVPRSTLRSTQQPGVQDA